MHLHISRSILIFRRQLSFFFWPLKWIKWYKDPSSIYSVIIDKRGGFVHAPKNKITATNKMLIYSLTIESQEYVHWHWRFFHPYAKVNKWNKVFSSNAEFFIFYILVWENGSISIFREVCICRKMRILLYSIFRVLPKCTILGSL